MAIHLLVGCVLVVFAHTTGSFDGPAVPKRPGVFDMPTSWAAEVLGERTFRF